VVLHEQNPEVVGGLSGQAWFLGIHRNPERLAGSGDVSLLLASHTFIEHPPSRGRGHQQMNALLAVRDYALVEVELRP
jgi:hypothetical protein